MSFSRWTMFSPVPTLVQALSTHLLNSHSARSHLLALPYHQNDVCKRQSLHVWLELAQTPFLGVLSDPRSTRLMACRLLSLLPCCSRTESVLPLQLVSFFSSACSTPPGRLAQLSHVISALIWLRPCSHLPGTCRHRLASCPPGHAPSVHRFS